MNINGGKVNLITTISNLALFCFLVTKRLVSSKNISSINLILDIIQTSIIAVGDDGMALCLEDFEVVLDSTAEEGAALFQGWLIDDYLSTLCLDTLHDTLDG